MVRSEWFHTYRAVAVLRTAVVAVIAAATAAAIAAVTAIAISAVTLSLSLLAAIATCASRATAVLVTPWRITGTTSTAITSIPNATLTAIATGIRLSLPTAIGAIEHAAWRCTATTSAFIINTTARQAVAAAVIAIVASLGLLLKSSRCTISRGVSRRRYATNRGQRAPRAPPLARH